MVKKLLICLAVLAAVFGLCVWHEASDRPAFATGAFAVIRPDGKVLRFNAEIARSEAEQAYGLMFVQSLADDAGMVFPYDPPRVVAFWMKNTLIPLDMLFIWPDRKIGRIVTNATPRDLTPVSSEQPVSAVIEIKGGMVDKLGIAVGDEIDFADSP